MNLSSKGFLTNKDVKLNTSNKITTLNPNAAEFVPFVLRSASGNTANNTDVTTLDVSGTSGKAVLDRSESAVSNNSDDEAHQYWRRQLPDDITPDFKSMREDDLQGHGSLSVAGLSVYDGIERSRFSASVGGDHLLTKQHATSSQGDDGISLGEKMRYSFPTFAGDQSSAAFVTLPMNRWDKRFVNSDQHLTNGREGHHYNGNSSAGFLNELSENTVLDDTEINPADFLALQFPSFSAESLADVYYANGCDLNMTLDMLTQLELQGDGSFNQNLNSKTLSAPNLGALDFSALSLREVQNGLPKYTEADLQQAAIPYQSVDKDSFLFLKSNSSDISRGAADYASAVRKIASQDSGQWKYERNGSAGGSVGTSRNAQILASTYSGHGRPAHGDKLQSYGTVRAAPVLLETGDAMANMYSELRDEARDHARLRNACLDQAQQAYLIGNKALSKELTIKGGQLHNLQMKAAHGKARETTFRLRNPVAPEDYGRGLEQLIDLHGMHLSEAMHVLKQELSMLKSAARSSAQRIHVSICVGTGPQTKGSRTPARLLVAIGRYLWEEGLEYTEPQPGILRIVIY